MPNFTIANKIEIANPHANVDVLYGPYNSLAEAKATVVSVLREKGLTVGVYESGAVVEYWWKAGTTDADLVLKQDSIAGLIIESETPPNSPKKGLRWLNLTNGIEYTYIQNAWVDLNASNIVTLSHAATINKNSEAAFQHLDTTQSKTTPIDEDSVGLWDSVTNVFKRTTWANIKATLKTYFDPLYEKLANKQNSLAVDGTGAKFPTVDAVNAGLAALPNTLIAEYVHTSNLEISGFTVDTTTGVFTKAGHGLENNDMLFPTLNSNNVEFDSTAYSTLKEFIFQNFMNVKSERYVINATANTFQLSLTSGGAAETYINLGTTDITKWHFERISNLPGNIRFNNINKSKVKVELIGKFATGISPYLRITINTEVAGNVYLSSGSNVLQQIVIPNYGTIGTISADFVLNSIGTFARINSKLIKEKDLSSLKIDELFYKPAVGTISSLKISYYYPLNNSSIKITTL